MTTSENTEKLKEFTYNNFINGKLDSDSLVQQIELCGMMLNLKTIPDYAKEKGMSYNGVKKCRNVIEIFGVKFVIDND